MCGSSGEMPVIAHIASRTQGPGDSAPRLPLHFLPIITGESRKKPFPVPGWAMLGGEERSPPANVSRTVMNSSGKIHADRIQPRPSH